VPSRKVLNSRIAEVQTGQGRRRGRARRGVLWAACKGHGPGPEGKMHRHERAAREGDDGETR
jgi:hypothetical protein